MWCSFITVDYKERKCFIFYKIYFREGFFRLRQMKSRRKNYSKFYGFYNLIAPSL